MGSQHSAGKPLLRSLADRAARAAINMALPTELFAPPPPRLRCLKDAGKEQAPSLLHVVRQRVLQTFPPHFSPSPKTSLQYLRLRSNSVF